MQGTITFINYVTSGSRRNPEEIRVQYLDFVLCNIWQKKSFFAKNGVILRHFCVKILKNWPFFKKMILATTNLKVHSASIVAFRILSATLPCFVWITQKNYTINIFFLIFSDFSMLHTGFSSIKSTWQQRHLIPISGKIFYYFASCICINNTKNALTRPEQRKPCFHISWQVLARR